MSVVYNTLERIPTDGLILALDAKNPRSYDPSKYSSSRQIADWYDLSSQGNHFKVWSDAYETSTKTFHFHRTGSTDTSCAAKFYGDPVGINDNQLTIVSFTALGDDNGTSSGRFPGGACLFHMSTALGGTNSGPNLIVGGGGYGSSPDIYSSRLWTNFSYNENNGGSRTSSSTDIKMIWWKIDASGWTHGLNQDTTGTNNFSASTLHTKSGGITNIGGAPFINHYFDANGNINPDPGPPTSPEGKCELDGRMSSFFCYNRFLSSSELLDIYNKHRKIAGI